MPGSAADSRVFKESAFFQRRIIPGRCVLHPGFRLLGDREISLECWLLKPYPSAQLVARTRLYYKVVCSTCVVVEQACGLLKGNWRILHHQVCAETEFVPAVVDACVRLHNYFLDSNDDWSADAGAQDVDASPSVALDLVGPSYTRALAKRRDVLNDLWMTYA